MSNVNKCPQCLPNPCVPCKPEPACCANEARPCITEPSCTPTQPPQSCPVQVSCCLCNWYSVTQGQIANGMYP